MQLHIYLLSLLAIFTAGLFVQHSQTASPDQCMHSFERFAYEGLRDVNEPLQLPSYPWQSVDAILEDIPENLYLSDVQLARDQATGVELWLAIGLNYEPYVSAIINSEDHIWLVYTPHDHQTKLVSGYIEGTAFTTYKLYIDGDSRIWGSVVPILSGDESLSTTKTFPVLSVFNESTQKFELLPGILEITGDWHSFDIVQGDENTLWILVDHDAIYSFNTKTRTTKRWVDLTDMEPGYPVTGVDGNLYFMDRLTIIGNGTTGEQALYQFSKLTGKLTQVPTPSDWPFYRGLGFDDKGQLWLGSTGFRDTEGQWHLLHTNPEEFIESWYFEAMTLPTLSLISSDGRLWFTNWWEDVNARNGSAWYDPASGEGCMFTNAYTTIVEDSQQQLWLVARGNLYQYTDD